MADIGTWIRDGRKRLGLSQADVALKVGTNQAYVSQWETGKRAPSAGELARLKEVLGGEPSTFIASPAPAPAAPPSSSSTQPQAFALSLEEFQAMKPQRGRPPAAPVRVTSLLDQVVPTDSTHRSWLSAIMSYKCNRDTITGITSRLRGLKKNFADGLFDSVPVRIERSVVSDYMGQAEALLREGHAGHFDHVPAAVLAGAVLERWLRSLCERTDPPIPLTKDSGDPKTLNPLIDDLKRSGAITETRAKQLRAHAAIRNHAAHGEFDEFTRGEVEQMLMGVNNLVDDGVRET